MGTEILKTFGTLQSELEQARTSLKGVDENIKRLIGRDPSELPPRPNALKRAPQNEPRPQSRLIRSRNFINHENDEPPPNKKKRSGVSVFKRLSDRVTPYEHEKVHQQPQKQMISKVIVTPKELPSRQDALEAQSKDEQSKARNRRMFGALLGTLQKFQQEETKLKQKEEKRAQLEKKIEEHEIKEKEEIKKERQELFFNRKKKQAEIKMIELKMMRMKEYASWEERQKPRMNFIQTKSKPHIHYLPRKLTETSKALLESCKADIEKMIDQKRQEVYDELQHIEERTKRNFEVRKSKEVVIRDPNAKSIGEDEDDDDLEENTPNLMEDEKKIVESSENVLQVQDKEETREVYVGGTETKVENGEDLKIGETEVEPVVNLKSCETNEEVTDGTVSNELDESCKTDHDFEQI